MHSYNEGKIVVLPVEQPLVRHSAGGAKVRGGGQPYYKPKQREAFTNLCTARLSWHCSLTNGTHAKPDRTLKKQSAITSPANPFVGMAVGDVEVAEARPSAGSAVPRQEENRSTAN